MGVLCAQFIPMESVAAAASVGLAIGAMYYARCIHPPGGATALVAVIGGEQIRALGLDYIISPIMLNAVIILIVAFLFNYLFNWRRYPAYLTLKEQEETTSTDGYDSISHADLVYALSEIDSFIDVSEEDLLRIYKLATGRNVTAGGSSNQCV